MTLQLTPSPPTKTVGGLARAGGIALSTGAVLGIAGHLLGGLSDSSNFALLGAPWTAAQFCMLIGGEFMLLGLPVVYRHQEHRSGAFGLIAFALVFGGLLR